MSAHRENDMQILIISGLCDNVFSLWINELLLDFGVYGSWTELESGRDPPHPLCSMGISTTLTSAS